MIGGVPVIGPGPIIVKPGVKIPPKIGTKTSTEVANNARTSTTSSRGMVRNSKSVQALNDDAQITNDNLAKRIADRILDVEGDVKDKVTSAWEDFWNKAQNWTAEQRVVNRLPNGAPIVKKIAEEALKMGLENQPITAWYNDMERALTALATGKSADLKDFLPFPVKTDTILTSMAKPVEEKWNSFMDWLQTTESGKVGQDVLQVANDIKAAAPLVGVAAGLATVTPEIITGVKGSFPFWGPAVGAWLGAQNNQQAAFRGAQSGAPNPGTPVVNVTMPQPTPESKDGSLPPLPVVSSTPNTTGENIIAKMMADNLANQNASYQKTISDQTGIIDGLMKTIASGAANEAGRTIIREVTSGPTDRSGEFGGGAAFFNPGQDDLKRKKKKQLHMSQNKNVVRKLAPPSSSKDKGLSAPGSPTQKMGINGGKNAQ